MIEMDLYESTEELGLFGGDQLLLGLGSPLEPDLPGLFPDGRESTNVVEQLVKEQPAYQKRQLVTSTLITPSSSKSSEQASCLDISWLDTKLDLFDLLGETHYTTDESSSHIISPAPCMDNLHTTEEPSAEDLLNQISQGPSQMLSPVAVAPTDCDSLLSEVFNKLSSDIEQMVHDDTINLPDLGDGGLSPVSVADIESILSSPDSPPCTSTSIDSGRSSLMSTRPNSPEYVPDYDEDDIDYQPVTKKSRSRKRTAPYERSLPLDKKERKKLQNKNAALKYRQKKRGETDNLDEQLVFLETKNKGLKDKVESMTREIDYLKDLMAEVIKAKGIKLGK